MTAPAPATGSLLEAPLLRDWIVPQWPVPGRVRAFVTTRAGGASAAPFDTLNLGYGPPGSGAGRDDPASVAENRRRVQACMPGAAAWLSQVHGTQVVTIEGAPSGPPMADAAVTRIAGRPLAVLVADCLPVLLASREGDAVAIAHAGWRGLAGGVVERTLAALRCAAADVHAWLGPCIGADAFEVGAEVRDAFMAHDLEARCAFRPGGAGRWLADLPALARMRLRAAGVTSIHGGRECTVTDAKRFFSYRRDGATGRMGAFIWLDPVACTR